jgi:sirohydrochlorin ferrochelatase
MTLDRQTGNASERDALPDIVLLAHGSPDPRHRQGVEQLASGVRRLAPHRGVHPAYLDHHPPTPAEAAHDAGHPLVVVPVLLTPAYHARVDVPLAVANMSGVTPQPVQATPALGPHLLLLDAAVELLAAGGVSPGSDTGVVLFAAGSSDSAAVASIGETLRAHPQEPPWGPWRVAALGGGLALTDVVDRLRPQVERVVCVAFMVAEGVLRDRQAAQCAAVGVPLVDGALSGTEALAQLVLVRADASI